MRPKYTNNIKHGDDGAQIYWRALWAMEDDPICSMLSERTPSGLAGAYQEGMVDSNNVARFSHSGSRYYAKTFINRTPLSILGPEAKEHIGAVLIKAMFPEDED